MSRYEYRTHYEPLTYQQESIGRLMFKQSREDFGTPQGAAFALRSQQQILSAFGEDGWELVSTEAVWRAVGLAGNNQTDLPGNGHCVVDGYLFFFKKQLP
ncbi:MULTISPECIES: hypothetical protein [Stutzerimonas]|uniref:hypothetical protein n=2 Tax=Stutzerimonas TaxID=2901164 RepID=UPI000F7866F3|nr:MULTISPECIES: hypothetical protein [Stutzerimonas]MBT1119286.1 hypothetical protein [Stutzerimonas nitrititolerans]RRV44717.1 hypothetical protein EGJ26_20070 [Stutzerimonas stutzeri]RRV52103.1 hypothetical protein EGJ19_14875 [Stutzerimonas stutzeri]